MISGRIGDSRMRIEIEGQALLSGVLNPASPRNEKLTGGSVILSHLAKTCSDGPWLAPEDL